MENEQQYYELRSGRRSRSEVPLVPSQALAESESHYNLRSRSRDRSSTPGEIINGKRSSTGSKMHDQSMETITERKEEIMSLDAFNNHSKWPEWPNGQNEKKDSLYDEQYEEKSKDISTHRMVTSDYSSEEGEKEDLSDRYETISLNSLNIHEHRKSKIDYTKTYVVEQHLRNKQTIYTDSRGSTNARSRQLLVSDSPLRRVDPRKLNFAAPIDSNTKLDKAVAMSSRSNEQWTIMKRFIQFTSIVTLWFNRLFEFLKLKTVRRRDYHNSYKYSRYESKWYKAWQYVDRCLQYVYVFMVKAFFFDTWLLSRVSNIRKWMQRRSPKVLWVTLLPLLILMVVYTVKKENVISLDLLHDIPYDITKTCSRIYYDVVNITSFESDFLVGYLMKLRNFPAYILPSVNVSLSEIPNIGWNLDCWCSLYVSTSLLSIDDIIGQLRGQHRTMTELFLADRESSFKAECCGGVGDFKTIAEKLHNRISRLEDQTMKQAKCMEHCDLVDTYDEEIRTMKVQFNALKRLYSELKLCCNTRFDQISENDLEKLVETILAKYFGVSVSKKDLLKAVQTAILAAEGHESGVGANRNMNMNVDTGTGTDTDTDTDTGRVESSFVANDERVRKIVRDALRIYDADKTGRPDYALESAGGQIISTRCTERYDINTRAFKLLVFTFYYESNNPRTVIQGNPIQPGACWAFQGFPGYLLIKLRSFIYVTGFTVEHAPKLILPNGEMKSAPKKFNVWGFVDENDPLPVIFGDYEFAANDDNLQYFPVQNTTIDTPYKFVELRVNSNHGHLDYTCLYRFRVHGRPV